MQTVKAFEAPQNWGRLLDAVAQGEVQMIVDEVGIPIAAIISADDLARFQRLECEWDRPFAALDRTREAFKDVPEDELEQQVAQAVATARTQLRSGRGRPARTR